MILRFIFIILLGASFPARSEESSFVFGRDINIISSPSGERKAQVIRAGHLEIDESYDIIKIYEGSVEINEYPLVRNRRGMNRIVYAIKWSPDSRFLVILTKYGGGHSISQSPTTIYDSKQNSFWELNDLGGTITGEYLEFLDNEKLKINILDRSIPKTITVDLLKCHAAT